MSKTVFCKKLQKDLPAMTVPPMPGPKGLELMETVSQEAWESWNCLLYTSDAADE